MYAKKTECEKYYTYLNYNYLKKLKHWENRKIGNIYSNKNVKPRKWLGNTDKIITLNYIFDANSAEREAKSKQSWLLKNWPRIWNALTCGHGTPAPENDRWVSVAVALTETAQKCWHPAPRTHRSRAGPTRSTAWTPVGGGGGERTRVQNAKKRGYTAIPCNACQWSLMQQIVHWGVPPPSSFLSQRGSKICSPGRGRTIGHILVRLFQNK